MKTINRIEAVKIISQTEGKIFSAVFTKKDGSDRVMVCRFGVQKGVKGVGMAYEPHAYGLVTVFDIQKEEFRHINISTVRSLTVSGEQYEVA